MSEKSEFEIYVSIWAKAVETQMHFNEMCVKSRQLGLTFVAAALGIGIVLLSRGADFALQINWIILKFQIHVSVLIVVGAALALQAVRILDVNVYHKMLRGAVCFGEDFEENYMKKIFLLEKGMTQAISHFSRYEDAEVDKSGKKYKYIGDNEKIAGLKIEDFYKSSIRILILISLILFIFTCGYTWVGY